MTKLITLEVEVGLSAQRVDEESAQCQAADPDNDNSTHRIILCRARPRSMIGVSGVRSDIKSSIKFSDILPGPETALTHLLVHQPERQGLVTDQSLVMGFGIGHTSLLVTSVGESVDDVAHVPSVIGALFQQLDPHVRDGHGQSLVETNSSF